MCSLTFSSHFLPQPAVTEALMAPARYPESSGTRNLHDNLSDLRAQVAANRRGSQLVAELIDCYSLAVVQAYMGYIQVTTAPKNKRQRADHLVMAWPPPVCRAMRSWQ